MFRPRGPEESLLIEEDEEERETDEEGRDDAEEAQFKQAQPTQIPVITELVQDFYRLGTERETRAGNQLVSP